MSSAGSPLPFGEAFADDPPFWDEFCCGESGADPSAGGSGPDAYAAVQQLWISANNRPPAVELLEGIRVAGADTLAQVRLESAQPILEGAAEALLLGDLHGSLRHAAVDASVVVHAQVRGRLGRLSGTCSSGCGA